MPTEQISVLNLVLQGGSFALLAWYFIFGIDKRDKTIKEIQQIFVAELKEQRTLFREELAEERKARADVHQECEQSSDRQADAMRGVTSVLSAMQLEIQRMIDRSGEHRPFQGRKNQSGGATQ